MEEYITAQKSKPSQGGDLDDLIFRGESWLVSDR